jgi:hypothetical protein
MPHIQTGIGVGINRNAGPSWQSYWTTQYKDVDIQALIDDGYIPIASPSDLNAVRTAYSGASTRVFASGTKWETAAINTLGLSDKYVQANNIDLYAATRVGGVYYYAGSGWIPIGGNNVAGQRFGGIYDGGGFIIYGAYSNRIRSSMFGFFGEDGAGAIIRNLAVINGEFYSSVAGCSCVAHRMLYNSTIENVITSGKAISSSDEVGAICGAAFNDSIIRNCFSTTTIIGNVACGGICGTIPVGSTALIDYCLTVGRIICNGGGRVSGTKPASATLTNSFYNSDTTVSLGGNGEGKTTLQLTSTDELTFANWSTSIWKLRNGYYPLLRIAGITPSGILPTGKLPPQNLESVINETNHIILTWNALPGVSGYNIYLDNTGVITKLNTTALSNTEYDYTPADSGSYTFFVRGIYSISGFTDETGNSVPVTELFFLTELMKIDGDNIIIADTRNQTYIMTTTPPVAKEYGDVEYTIPLTDTVIEGALEGGWYGIGTTITRTFSDVKRTIIQMLTVESKRIKISNTITYNQDVNIEYEGIPYTTNIPLNRLKNIFVSGSGQHIVNNVGMYFHNGNYTYHHVIANINEDLKSKQYHNSDSENVTVNILDNSTYKPPVYLYQPNGHEASFTISNHADSAILDVQRCVHYGSSNINSAQYGTKGLTSRGIKSDWSVFAKATVTTPGFIDSEDYKNFLIALKAVGHEIVPHSLGTLTETREDAAMFLPEFKSAFSSSAWIDHSLGAGALNIGIASKGWDVTDVTNYMIDLFLANGFNKAWNYIDIVMDLVISTVYGFQHNIAYYNDHLSDNILLWNTSDRPFFRNWLNLDALINNYGYINAHEYIAEGASRISEGGDTMSMVYTHYLDNGEYKITSGFDRALRLIQQKKSDGKIWNPTCTEFYDYFATLKKVIVAITDSSAIAITNSGSAINGYSLLICKKGITPLLNGQLMNTKTVKDGTICWGDLASGENTITF